MVQNPSADRGRSSYGRRSRGLQAAAGHSHCRLLPDLGRVQTRLAWVRPSGSDLASRVGMGREPRVGQQLRKAVSRVGRQALQRGAVEGSWSRRASSCRHHRKVQSFNPSRQQKSQTDSPLRCCSRNVRRRNCSLAGSRRLPPRLAMMGPLGMDGSVRGDRTTAYKMGSV
jgi:hypothetical protein